MTRPRITRRFILTRALLVAPAPRRAHRPPLSYPQVYRLRARIAQRLATSTPRA